jgi:2-polyprenyl-3-methyl-5-hydroxy-6-metoxy-1,4-benzoquinol methylase
MMDQAYATEYRNLYERHWWWRSREEEILRLLNQVFGEQRDKSVLDVGCGDGLLFEKLQKFGRVTGVEADPNTLTTDGPWRKQIHCQLFDDRFRPGKKYDAILMLDILEHMPDPAAAVQHAKTLLREDGILIATVPAFNCLWTSHDDLNHHVVRYTKRTFCPLIEQGGFLLKQSRYLFHWTCPVKLAIRFKEWVGSATPQPPRVPSWLINRVCWGLSKLEQATISRLPMPFGSSLLVVAQAVEG